MFFMSGVNVRKVATEEDYESVLYLRQDAYPVKKSIDFFRDPLDEAENAIVLIAEDQEGTPLGTIRIMNRVQGPIELDQYVDVEKIIKKHSKTCAEATRFIIAPHFDQETILLALYKAYYRFCKSHGITTALISSRQNLTQELNSLTGNQK